MERIIVIGGGAAGLNAANELLNNGYDVLLLEASDRLGGRIHTIHNQGFTQPVEKGTEFIHGNLPLTMELIKQAGLEYKSVRGRMFRLEDGELKAQDEFAEGWTELMEKMNELKDDMTFADFLNKNFSDQKYDELRETSTRFAEGFDVADTGKASTLGLRAEWMEEEDEQYRLIGGFDQLVNYLAGQCRKKGGTIQLSQQVKKISWKRGHATVTTQTENTFDADKVITTVSLGVLKADPPLIEFQPSINNYLEAAKKIGFGNVVKVLLQFSEPFWQEKKKHLGFVFSQEKIPTWWTQLPLEQNILTGWAGGGQASHIDSASDDVIFKFAIESLSKIFETDIADLGKLVTAFLVANWENDPLSKGAYSYNMLETVDARNLLNTPVQNTLFFAGEGLYDGTSPGTVEAALVSGKNTAQVIIDSVQSSQNI